MLKRTCLLLLALVMAIALLPMAAYAEEATPFDLAAAIANAEEGETITLTENITITEATEFKMKNGVILDLKGHTISAKDGKAIFTGANFTIKNGTFQAIGSKDYYLLTVDSASTKALRSASNINLSGLTVVGGGIKIRGGANVTLSGNYVTANQSLFKYAVWAYGSATVNIESGTYIGGKNGYDVFEEGKANITISGGTYKYAIGERYLNEASGYVWIKNADGGYTAIYNPVASINGVPYASLDDAVAAVKADETIVLEKDIAVENVAYALPAGAVLNLNGHTLTTTGATFTGTGITIKDGKIALPEGNTNYYILYIGSQNGEKTTAALNNVQTTAGIQVINADAALSNVTAKGGNHKSRFAVAAFVNSNVTVHGGSFTSYSSAKRDLSMDATSSVTVYGGTFSKNVPDDYLAEGYISVKDGSSYIVRKGKYVAEVNGKRYESLQAAINAAPTYYTVKLLDNITVTKPIVISSNITLNLGAYTITGNTSDAVLRIYSDVVDTKIGVTIDATTGGIVNNGSGYAIYAGEDLSGGSDAERTNLTINGGTYVTAGTDCIRQIMGKCTINGGSYKSSYGRTVLNGVRWYGAEFAINGGSFYEFNPACVSVWTGFDGKDHDNNFYHQHDIIAAGKTATYADGWYTVVEGEYVAKASTKSLCYPSIEAALKASINLNDVANLGTITLLGNDTLDLGGETITLPKGLVIDLDGNTLTVPFQKTLFAGENITIKNGTITTGSTENYGLYIMGGSFTLENITATNGINVQGGTVTMEDVNATCPNKYYAVYAGAEADVTILSGNFKTVRNAKNLYASGKITVYSGTFNKNVEDKFLAEDRVCVKSGSSYIVVKAVKTYEELTDAIAAAKAGDVVVLGADIFASKSIAIDKDITLNLGEYVIWGNSVSNTIVSTADLTINATTGGIISNGCTVILQNDGVCTINGGNYRAKGETGDHANGKPVYNSLVLNNTDFYTGVTGSFKINGGSFYGFNPGCLSVNKHDHHDHDSIAAGKAAKYENGWFTVVDGEFAYEVVCDCKAPASAHQHCFMTEAEAEAFIEANGNCKFDKVVAIAD